MNAYVTIEVGFLNKFLWAMRTFVSRTIVDQHVLIKRIFPRKFFSAKVASESFVFGIMYLYMIIKGSFGFEIQRTCLALKQSGVGMIRFVMEISFGHRSELGFTNFARNAYSFSQRLQKAVAMFHSDVTI